MEEEGGNTGTSLPSKYDKNTRLNFKQHILNALDRSSSKTKKKKGGKKDTKVNVVEPMTEMKEMPTSPITT